MHAGFQGRIYCVVFGDRNKVHFNEQMLAVVGINRGACFEVPDLRIGVGR